jgi:hypothetical protein
MSSISWIDITIDFGNDFINYKSRWLRKDDMELAFEKDNNWVTIDNSKVEKDKHMLKCNITPEPLYGFDVLFDDILSRTNSPVFTVTGWLDADGDDYYNDEDAFPFDPAARYDSDGDGSPGNNEWVPGKGPSQSTTDPPLYEDRFPNDPAASIDDDNDGCPDKWNPGMSGKNSTTNLTLDKFPGETDKCLDTDNDNLPDGDKYNSENWMDRDDDDDDIPDYWELAKNDEALERGLSFLFDPKDRNDGAADWDGDGRNNTQEYYDKTDPFKKDKPEEEDDGVLSIAGSNMFLIGLIIVIVLIILLVVFLRMRGKKEPEELPRGMGGAPPPEEPMPEEITDTGYEEEGVYEEEEILEEPLGEEDTGEIYDETGEEIGLDEQTAETTEEGGVVQPEETTEIETDTGVEEGTGELEQGPEMMEDTGETETAGESETIESTEGTVNEPVQFTCPNCNTLVTPDMPACPGCKTPLTFDQ